MIMETEAFLQGLSSHIVGTVKLEITASATMIENTLRAL